MSTKKLSIIIFLIAFIPYGKLEICNGIIMAINIGLIITKNALSLLDYFFLFASLLGVFIIFYYKNRNIIAGYLLTYTWLGYKLSWLELVNSLTILVSIIIYLIISLLTIYANQGLK